MLRRRNSLPALGMAREVAHRPGANAASPPDRIRPQLTELVDAAPDGTGWLHEIKYDGFRMHAQLDHGEVRLLTRSGLDWTHKYPQIAANVAALAARQAYLDGELCGVRADGITSFSMIQMASDAANAAGLVFFLFDLLRLDGEDLSARPLIERKERLARLLAPANSPLHFGDHQIGLGPSFYEKACALGVEGIVLKRAGAPYMPGNRGLWLKVKCLNREEFVVIGWTDPEGARSFSAPCCSAIAIPPAGLPMPAASAPASTRWNSRGCGGGCNRWRSRRCRSTCRRRARPASDRRWSSAACIGCGPTLSLRSNSSPGRKTTFCAKSSMKGLREDKRAAEVRRAVPYPKADGAAAATKSKRRSTAACIAGKRESAMRGGWRFAIREQRVGEPHSAEAGSRITNGA